MKQLNLLLIIILSIVLFLGAAHTANRFQISAGDKMYCWILDTMTGKLQVANYRDGKINILDTVEGE